MVDSRGVEDDGTGLPCVDCRSATQARDSHRGDFNDPFTEAEIRAKFRQLAGTVLTADGAAAAEAALDRCDEWTNLDELTALCRQYSRAS